MYGPTLFTLAFKTIYSVHIKNKSAHTTVNTDTIYQQLDNFNMKT